MIRKVIAPKPLPLKKDTYTTDGDGKSSILNKVPAKPTAQAHESNATAPDKHRGGRGNKKEVTYPFDITLLPPVVHMKDVPESWPADYAYIGREGKGFDGRFGNPFRIGGFYGDRDEVCDRHIKWLVNELLFTKTGEEKLNDYVSTLKGKTLVCFCKPARCHGDFLRILVNAPDPKEVLRLHA